MPAIKNPLTVFTKPWPDLTLPKLGALIKGMGFDGVELPVRPNFQVNPDNVTQMLPEAVKILAEYGLKIGSVAGSTEEKTIAAMGDAGIRILRVMAGIDTKIGYIATEQRARQEYDALLPILDKHGVTIGVQNHSGECVGSAIGLMHLIEKYNPKHVSAVLDQAHCSLVGEPESLALDIVWSHLCLVNFKSVFRMRVNGPEAPEAKWTAHWTTARHGMFSWSLLVNYLKEREYRGDICLCAEYSAPTKGSLTGADVIPLLGQDVEYIKYLLAQEKGNVRAGFPSA